MYGAGLVECLRLRVQDIDVVRNGISVCDGKGGKDRITMLPESLKHLTIQELMEHKDVSTSMIYTHVLNKGGHGVRSPIDGP